MPAQANYIVARCSLPRRTCLYCLGLCAPCASYFILFDNLLKVLCVNGGNFLSQRSYLKLHFWLKRIGWLVLIWTASVLALAVAAYLMRLFMHAIGLY